jgi:hypothetical protein
MYALAKDQTRWHYTTAVNVHDKDLHTILRPVPDAANPSVVCDSPFLKPHGFAARLSWCPRLTQIPIRAVRRSDRPGHLGRNQQQATTRAGTRQQD